jgi:hypothetical protein
MVQSALSAAPRNDLRRPFMVITPYPSKLRKTKGEFAVLSILACGNARDVIIELLESDGHRAYTTELRDGQ